MNYILTTMEQWPDGLSVLSAGLQCVKQRGRQPNPGQKSPDKCHWTKCHLLEMRARICVKRESSSGFKA